MKRALGTAALVLLVLAAAGWIWRNELVGVATRVYLARLAAAEEDSGDLTQRRAAVARVHRMLLMQPPADALVPELFDLLGALTPRVSSGEINLDWAAYVYTSYMRDLTRDRPRGTPRRSSGEIDAAVAEYVHFYTLQKRHDVPAPGLRAVTGQPEGESYTVEEIERAAREGREIP